MKKIIALVMCLAILCASVSALAYKTTSYSINTSSTSEYQIASSQVTTTGANWYITYSSGNLSGSHRAVTRVHKGATAISSTWVYSGSSTTSHPYKSGYTGGGVSGVTFRGRLDDRDSGTLLMSGNFNY
jgi:hypothetical protein